MSTVRCSVVGWLAATMVIAAASCGSDTERDDEGASSEGSGATGAAGPGAGGAATSTGGPTTSASSSTGAGGTCGGFAGEACPPDAFCDYPDDLCGAADGTGSCVPRPQACEDNYLPTCSCDGMVYGNACDANAAGFDVNNLDGCTPPDGMFSCGSMFCAADGEYCQRSGDDTGGPDGYACLPLPLSCSGADCSCLANEPCGELCMQDADGHFTLTCLGG